MHYLIGLITAVMVLFPAADSGGKSLYQRWMESYEKYLYQQMAENFEREKRDRNAEICQNPSESEVSNEQTASEEAGESHDLLPEASQNDCEVRSENSEVAEEQTEVETSDAVPLPAVVQTPLFSVNGAVLDIGVQEYLYQRLCEANIGWFYHYAILIAYQESRFDPLAVNPNGKDFGLFQFRLQYHPDLDWANPYAQVDRFVLMMANRAANGKTAAEMISAHNQSDYGPYCQEYVSIVMSHEAGMVQIR